MSHGPCQPDSLARPTRPIPVCKLRPDNVAATFRGPQEAAVFNRQSPYETPQTLCLRDMSNHHTPFAQGAPESCQITGSSPTADIITPSPRLMMSDLIFKRVQAQSHKYDAIDTFGRRKIIAQNLMVMMRSSPRPRTGADGGKVL
jgi:hypothetical protein